LIVQVTEEKNNGHFIFAKSILISNKILSTNNNEGKRGFRVYSPADIPTSKQATKTKNWQISHFASSEDEIDLEKIKSSFPSS